MKISIFSASLFFIGLVAALYGVTLIWPAESRALVLVRR